MFLFFGDSLSYVQICDKQGTKGKLYLTALLLFLTVASTKKKYDIPYIRNFSHQEILAKMTLGRCVN